MKLKLPYDAEVFVKVLSAMQSPNDFADRLKEEIRWMHNEASTAFTLALGKVHSGQGAGGEVAMDGVGGARNPEARTRAEMAGNYPASCMSASVRVAD